MDLMNDSAKIFLNTNLRFLRKELNLSQEEMANRVGLNRGNIASYENGSAEPKICNLLKFAKIFGVSLLDLTQRDLTIKDTESVPFDSIDYQTNPQEVEIINSFTEQAEELEVLFQSLHNCCMFKVNQIKDKPKDVQIMLAHFDQLYEASQGLLTQYQELLHFVKRKL